MNGLTISILGCGWYGQALASYLIQQGNRVKGSTTTPGRLAELQQWGILPYLIDLRNDADTDFFDCDMLVVAFNVKLDKRPGYLAEIEKLSRLATRHAIKQIIFISSTSVYGSVGAHIDEHTLPQPETESAKALHAAEQILASNQKIKTTVIRFGGLVGPAREPGRFLAGKKDLANGLSPVNLIHLTDCVGLTAALLTGNVSVPVINGVSPDHPSRKDFYELASAHAGLPLPEFRLEQTESKLVGTAYPEVYTYQVTDWLTYYQL